jgi:hypothetical protein
MVEKRAKNSGPLEDQVRRYILGELTAEEEQEFDQRLMAGDDEFLLEIEEKANVLHDELVEDYLSEKLSRTEKAAFETSLLPSRKIAEKIILDKALRVVSCRQKRSLLERIGVWAHPIIQPVPIAVCTGLLLVAGGSWSVYRISALQSQLDQALSSQSSNKVASLRSQLAAERKNRQALVEVLPQQQLPHVGVASFILKPGLMRSGGETKQIVIRPEQTLVALKLDVGVAEYATYRAALHDSEDSELVVASKLRAVTAGNSVHVPFNVPAQVLRPDDYQVRLSGLSASKGMVMIDSYPFRVVGQ